MKSNRDFTSNSAHPFESRGEEGAKVFKATLNELTEDAIKHYTKRVLK